MQRRGDPIQFPIPAGRTPLTIFFVLLEDCSLLAFSVKVVLHRLVERQTLWFTGIP